MLVSDDHLVGRRDKGWIKVNTDRCQPPMIGHRGPGIGCIWEVSLSLSLSLSLCPYVSIYIYTHAFESLGIQFLGKVWRPQSNLTSNDAQDSGSSAKISTFPLQDS